MSLWLKLKKTKKNRYLSHQTPAPSVDLPLFAPENFELITQAVEDKKAIGQMIPESRQEHESFHEEMTLKAHEAANNIGLSKRVFAARLQGLEAILTVRLAASPKRPKLSRQEICCVVDYRFSMNVQPILLPRIGQKLTVICTSVPFFIGLLNIRISPSQRWCMTA